MFKIVEFPSQGATLRGRLYINPESSKPLPVVIMAHGFSATINGMVADHYAEGFYDSGFAVLLYDHRNFGISDGEPRQEINIWIQTRGYRDAINFITSLPEIDSSRIAIWGDSLSGAEVTVVGALDPRVKAIIAQVPAFGDEPPQPDPDGTLFAPFRETFLNSDLDSLLHKTRGPLPVVSFSQSRIPSMLTPLSAYRWFIEYGGRYDTKWENSATITSLPDVPFQSGICAAYINVPVLMMIAREDEMTGASSSVARKVFESVPRTKELVEIEGGHFGLLHYPSDLFDQASKTQRDFLKTYL